MDNGKKAFNPDEAFEILKKNRILYIDRLMKYLNHYINCGDPNYDMASNYIVAAADNLRGVNGALDYMEAAKDFEKDGYPEFGTIFD